MIINKNRFTKSFYLVTLRGLISRDEEKVMTLAEQTPRLYTSLKKCGFTRDRALRFTSEGGLLQETCQFCWMKKIFDMRHPKGLDTNTLEG